MGLIDYLKDKKIELSLLLLVLSVPLGIFIWKTRSAIPYFDERIEISRHDIVLTKKYNYLFENNYPVSVQKIRLSSLYSNLIEVRDGTGRLLNYKRKGNKLLVFFNRPLKKGKRVIFSLKASVHKNWPYFYVLDRGNKRYTFHYISWESYPGFKHKSVVLPEGSRVLRARAPRLHLGVEKSKVELSGHFNRFQRFDLTVDFVLPEGYRYAIKATPTFVKGRMVTFRVPRELFTTAPAIRANFTQWRTISMQPEGNAFVYRTMLPPGRYYYQFLYFRLPLTDDSSKDYASIRGIGPVSVIKINK